MKTLAALLAAIVAVPVAAAAGYVLNGDPAPLTVAQTIKKNLKADGEPQEQWLYVVTKGELRGQESDAGATAAVPEAELKDYPGRYVVRTCSFFSTTGKPKELFDAEIVGRCTARFVTKKQVLEHERTLKSSNETS